MHRTSISSPWMRPRCEVKKMDTVTLTIKTQPELYLELEKVNPDVFAGKKADEIAIGMGIPEISENRIRAAVLFLLQERAGLDHRRRPVQLHRGHRSRPRRAGRGRHSSGRGPR